MTGRFPCLACIALVAGLLSVGRPLHAELQYQLTAGGSVGVSDNPTAESAETSAESGVILGAHGNVGLAHVGRLTLNRINYGFTATRLSGYTILSQTLNLSSEIQASAATTLRLHGGAVMTRFAMLDYAAPTGPQAVGPRPAGDSRFLTVSAGEAVAWQGGGSWRVTQSLEGQLFRPLDDEQGTLPHTKAATFETEVAHTWPSDSVGLRGRLGAIWISAATQTEPTTTVPDHSEFIQGELTWRHEWTREITQRMSGGLFVLRAGGQQYVLPAAAAGVTWRGVRHQVDVRAARTADTNIYLGTAYERSVLSLTLGLPLDRYETLRLESAAAFEHASTVGTGGSANVLSLRCGLRWQPGDMFSFGLDYMLWRQYASGTDAGPSAFSTFQRQTAMLTVEVQYPPRGYYH